MPFVPKDFPAAEDLARVKTEDDYFKLLDCQAYDYEGMTDKGAFALKEFFSNDKKKAKILAISLNLAPLIVEAGTDFLFGEPFAVKVDGDGNEEAQKKIDAFVERNRAQERMEESSQLLQGIGHAHFKLFSKNGEARLEEVPYSYWFPNWSGVSLGQEPENVRLVTYLTKVDASGAKKQLVYVEDYFIERAPGENSKAKVVIEYSLWEDKSGKVGDNVDLALHPELIPASATPVTVADGTEDKPTGKYREKTGLEELPFVSVNLRKTVMHRYGVSIFKKIMPLLSEINDRLTQVSIQFLKHLNAKLQIPDGSARIDPKTGNIIKTDMEVLLAKAGEPDAKYITNENPLIEQAFIHLEKLIRACAKLTKTPDSFLVEDEKGGVEKAEALKTRMMVFLKRVRNYQRKYDDAIKRIVRLALKIEGVEKSDTVPLKIVFDVGLPKDWEHDETVWGNALDRGLASRETAVGRFQGIEGDELEEELSRIDTEEEERTKARMAELLAAGAGDDAEDEE